MYDSRQSIMGGQQEQGNNYGYDGSRNRYPRMQSEPPMSRQVNGRGVYPIPNNHRSYETVASGSGSGSYGEPVGYQTDPTSSENSSIERRSPQKRQEPINDYGINFGHEPSYQPPNFGVNPSSRVAEPSPPPLPRKNVGGSLLRKATQLGPPGNVQDRPTTAEKRKSWFSRRFSKTS